LISVFIKTNKMKGNKKEKEEFINEFKKSANLYQYVINTEGKKKIKDLKLTTRMSSISNRTLGACDSLKQPSIAAFHVLKSIFDKVDDMLDNLEYSTLYFTYAERKSLGIDPNPDEKIFETLKKINDPELSRLKEEPQAFIFHKIIKLHYGGALHVDKYKKNDFTPIFKKYRCVHLKPEDFMDKDINIKSELLTNSLSNKLHYIYYALDIKNSLKVFANLETLFKYCENDFNQLDSLISDKTQIEFLKKSLQITKDELKKIKQPKKEEPKKEEIKKEEIKKEEPPQKKEELSKEVIFTTVQELVKAIVEYINANKPKKQGEHYEIKFKEIQLVEA
jgi:hypothetical protein